jgi:hypothetical protein
MENAEAQRLAPASAAITLQFGMASAAAGRDADALTYADAAGLLGVDTAGRRSKQLYADIAARAGRYGEAADLMVSVLPQGVRAAGGEDAVRLAYTAMGDSKRRSAAIAGLQKLNSWVGPEDWVMKVWSMNWYSQLGALDPAYDLAEQLRVQFKDQSPTNAWAWLWTPEMRAFRQEPRFQAFTTRLGLMAFWQQYGPPDNCDLQGTKLTCH